MANPPNRRRLRLVAAVTVVKALSARVLLVIHMAFSIWAATCVVNSASVWALMSVLGLFLVETVYSIVKRKGQEPQWFSPCIFLYLLAVVPPIWILNLDMISCLISSRQYGNGSCVGLASSGADCALVSLDSYFSRKPLAYTLEEIMLLLLIVSRWLLPKGNITRDQLSLLLLVYFGIGFDIMELFYLFEELDVLLSRGTTYAILVVWTVSLFQFTIVLTTVKSRRPRLSLQTTPLRRLVACRCCQFEIWGLLTSVFMQDGPFLILRLYCFIGMKLFSYNLLFYTVKNVLVVVLQAYRFVVLLLNCRENFDTDMERSASMASIASVKQRNGSAGPRAVDGASSSAYKNQSRNASHISLNQSQDFSFESAV